MTRLGTGGDCEGGVFMNWLDLGGEFGWGVCYILIGMGLCLLLLLSVDIEVIPLLVGN